MTRRKFLGDVGKVAVASAVSGMLPASVLGPSPVPPDPYRCFSFDGPWSECVPIWGMLGPIPVTDEMLADAGVTRFDLSIPLELPRRPVR